MKMNADEDLQALVNELNGTLYTYERALSELDNTCAVQSARIAELEAALDRHAKKSSAVDAALMRKNARIAELESQLAAALATIEAATQPTEWCDDCGMPVEHCRENHADGKDYAEGCKP